MSVLIKGMDMPKAGDTFHFAVTFGYGKMAIIDPTGENGPILFDVSEVPTPHGRLIDADALMELAQNCIYKTVDCNDIARVPTVIEAEE